MLKQGERRPFYAIGGTWRSLARLHMRQKGYPLHVMHEYSIPAGEAADFCRMVARRDIEIARFDRGGLAQPPGAAALRRRRAGAGDQGDAPSTIIMSALGVREGLLYDLLDAKEKARDPLIVACEELAYLRSRSPRHVAELVPGRTRRSMRLRP